jgi:hypothetical protein
VTASSIVAVAEYRYLNDAVFHARVHRAIQVVMLERGTPTSDNDKSLAVLTACVALQLEGTPLSAFI